MAAAIIGLLPPHDIVVGLIYCPVCSFEVFYAGAAGASTTPRETMDQ